MISCAQYQGARDQQEDSLFCSSIEHDCGHLQLAIVADGMGGYAGGAVASKTAVDAMVEMVMHNRQMAPAELLKTGLQAANQGIAEFIENHSEYLYMGTTILAVIEFDHRLHWVSVGDSYLYLLREQKLQLLNELHSYAQTLKKQIEEDSLSPSILNSSALKHVITSSVNGQEIPFIDQPEEPFELLKGDRLLLASDGIDTLNQEQLVSIMMDESNSDPARAIIQAVEAEQADGQDNVSAIVLQVLSKDQ